VSWLGKLMPSRIKTQNHRRSVPEGLWEKCQACEAVLYRAELQRNLNVCPKCTFHMRIGARQRLDFFLDGKPRVEIAAELESKDPLRFRDSRRYKERLNQAQRDTGEKDALVVIEGCLLGRPVVVCAFEFNFMAGSMGSVVGEKFARAGKRCLQQRVPLVCFSASGGARMQEALLSLLQMAKTAAVLQRMRQARIPFISVLTDPTTGGVSASMAMLGDINIAEPKALIGFAGPRVIQQTVGETLPAGFQRSEFLLQHGALDMILDRREMRDSIYELLDKLFPGQTPADEAASIRTKPEFEPVSEFEAE